MAPLQLLLHPGLGLWQVHTEYGILHVFREIVAARSVCLPPDLTKLYTYSGTRDICLGSLAAAIKTRVVPDIRPFFISGIQSDIRFHLPDIRYPAKSVSGTTLLVSFFVYSLIIMISWYTCPKLNILKWFLDIRK